MPASSATTSPTAVSAGTAGGSASPANTSPLQSGRRGGVRVRLRRRATIVR
jgi:hypothetical protein